MRRSLLRRERSGAALNPRQLVLVWREEHRLRHAARRLQAEGRGHLVVVSQRHRLQRRAYSRFHSGKSGKLDAALLSAGFFKQFYSVDLQENFARSTWSFWLGIASDGLIGSPRLSEIPRIKNPVLMSYEKSSTLLRKRLQLDEQGVTREIMPYW